MSELEDLISVVVPVYNMEKYLDRCVQSILAQAYGNLQIILVDDGSTDRSSKICDDYEKRDQRVEVIHKKNGGLSDARNTGTLKAKGKYISFIDSDDYISCDMIMELYKAIKKNEADMAICSFLYVDNYQKEIKELNKRSPIKEEVLSGKEVLEKLFEEQGHYYIVAWNKLYRKELFEDISFPVHKIHEDEFVIHHLLAKCEKIACTNKKLYYYVQREGSITASPSISSQIDRIEAILDRTFFCEKEGMNQYIGILYSYASSRTAMIICKKKDMAYKQYEAIKMNIRNHLGYLKYCNTKQKTLCFLSIYVPFLYRFLYIKLHNAV